MTILDPGQFRVADYRRAIPDWVKVQSVINAIMRGELPIVDGKPLDARELQYDHCPALLNRPYDTEAGDFIPPQNDPAYIVPLRKGAHLEKTTGRREGAEKTVSGRGSDVTEAARTRKIRAREAVRRAAAESKAGRYDEAARILATAKPPRPKRKLGGTGRKIPSRPFPSRRPHTEEKTT